MYRRYASAAAVLLLLLLLQIIVPHRSYCHHSSSISLRHSHNFALFSVVVFAISLFFFAFVHKPQLDVQHIIRRKEKQITTQRMKESTHLAIYVLIFCIVLL